MAEKKIKPRLAELRGMGEADLEAVVEDARRAVYEIKRKRISQPVPNSKAIRTARKEIARVLTIKKQREIAAKAAK